LENKRDETVKRGTGETENRGKWGTTENTKGHGVRNMFIEKQIFQ
jgi:hypothetical protein